MLTAALAFAVVAGLLTLVPGIDTALVLRASVAGGYQAAYATVAGISLGILAWAVAAAVGVSALLAASQAAYTALQLAGAAYMIWLGVRLIWQARGGAADLRSEPSAPTSRGAASHFLRGLLTNLLNPKIGVFYVAVLPQFLPADAPYVLAGLVLAGVHVLEGLAWFSVLILGTQLMRAWLERDAVRAWIDRVTGGVLIGFGLKLAWSRP